MGKLDWLTVLLVLVIMVCGWFSICGASANVENGGFGAVYGVPIGALMMEQYIMGELSEASQRKVEDYSNRVIDYGEEER